VNKCFCMCLLSTSFYFVVGLSLSSSVVCSVNYNSVCAYLCRFSSMLCQAYISSVILTRAAVKSFRLALHILLLCLFAVVSCQLPCVL